MSDPIRECISNFGPAPRALSPWDRLTYFRVPKPLWLHMDPFDKLTILFRHARSLFIEGRVVWGHIVQANQLMFERGRINCPGEVVYSLADSERVDPGHLHDVAAKLYSLKGTEPDDAELATLAAYLADETIRVYGLPVPRIISPAIRCQISTTFFVRKHLPRRRLCAPLLPMVVNPSPPHVAMPLPARYWPADFIEWWSQ